MANSTSSTANVLLWVCLLVSVRFLSFVSSHRHVFDDNSHESFISQLLLEEPFDEAQCDKMALEIAATDAETPLDAVPRLQGKWVSQECEVRPGPVFLLRSYTFLKDGSFRLVQFHYSDESCIIPRLTLSAKGALLLRGGSWVTPGGTEAEYTLARVTVTPHSTQVAEEMSHKSNRSCAGQVRRQWKPHREYIIWNAQPARGRPSMGPTQRAPHDCLSALGFTFAELLLLRTQTRPGDDRKQRELLLGDVHSRGEARLDYSPTAFQTPLLRVDQGHVCTTCHLVARGTERSPPHLLSRPQLPPYLDGEWISLRCEVRPMGMFLRRRLSFDSRGHTWRGEYSFFSDPACVVPAFAIFTAGRYSRAVHRVRDRDRDTSRTRGTGTEFDFKMDRAKLALQDPTLKDGFAADDRCGLGPWTVGVVKDLGPTWGCALLGLAVPSTEFELVKLDMDNKGNPLLLLGLPDTDNRKRGPSERPTSYQPPLAQCSALPPLQQGLVHALASSTSASVPTAPTTASSNSVAVFSFSILRLIYL